MIIKPRIRGFICTTAHPVGCEAHVLEQINYIKEHTAKIPLQKGPKKVLVIGASTGYGLASRITAAFGSQADTVGVFFEKEPTPDHTATAGWYNTKAFEKAATAKNLYAKSINGDAFSDEIKDQTLRLLKEEVGPVDLVIYSIASPRRTHPKTGYVAKSVLKPINQAFSGITLDTDKEKIVPINITPATEEEIADTIAVMGGEDWEMWIDALQEAHLLADGCKTIAYTYLGAKPTWAIYGHAAIGKAKEDLDRTAKVLNQKLASCKGHAYVGVMKAIVTQASSAIPIMPLYISLLYKIMKDQNIHENCIQQIARLFSTCLYPEATNTRCKIDEAMRLRLDDLELRPEVQQTLEAQWDKINTENLHELTDFAGYQKDFLKLFGFGLPSVNYEAEVDPVV
jgi:enoyl-[acyl-carrier protein] reductase/trans-2-enoyl-CoA reductase (NAD+)